MRKSLIIVLLLILFLLTGCNNKIGKYISDERIDTIEGISVEVNKDTLTNKSLEYIIKNDTDTPLTYDTTEWFIEVYENHAWYHYAVTPSWVSEEKTIDAHSFIKDKVYFDVLYGKLNIGEYRFVKCINDSYIAAEFKIK